MRSSRRVRKQAFRANNRPMTKEKHPTGPRPAPTRSSYWLLEGQLLAGGYPGSFSPEVSRRRLSAMVDAGIRSFVDLTSEHDGLEPYEPVLKQLAAEKDLDLRYWRFAVQDLGIPTAALMTEVLDTIRAEMAANRPVYFHCWGGIGRTGTVAGCWLVEEGYPCDDALQWIATLREGTPDAYMRSPDTDEQVAFVREWKRARE